MNELPTITASSYSSTAADPSMFIGMSTTDSTGTDMLRRLQHAAFDVHKQRTNVPAQHQEPPVTARIVKVYIADPNENVPLEKRVLYTGEEKLTDLTDQELFFEVPIAELLAKHNTARKGVVDKKQTEKFGREIYLEPVRIRDLKMVVVTVAQFA